MAKWENVGRIKGEDGITPYKYIVDSSYVESEDEISYGIYIDEYSDGEIRGNGMQNGIIDIQKENSDGSYESEFIPFPRTLDINTINTRNIILTNGYRTSERVSLRVSTDSEGYYGYVITTNKALTDSFHLIYFNYIIGGES